jgi:HD-GYP domain-containing protein (c-di-GMP phosphodiesterase class II)
MTSPLQVIYDIFPGFVLLIDKKGTILDYRQKQDSGFVAYFDVARQKNLQDVLPHSVREQLRQTIEEVTETGQSSSFNFHWLFNNQNLWFELRIAATDNAHFIVVIRDLTPTKQADEKIQKQSRWLSSLRAIDEAITANVDLPFILSLLLFHITAQLKVDAANVLLRNPSKTILESVARLGFRSTSFEKYKTKIGVGYAGKAALDGKIVHVSELSIQDDGFPKEINFIQDKFVEYYAIPLTIKDKTEGVLEIYHRSPLQWGLDDLNLLEMFAKQAAIAVDRAALSDGIKISYTEIAQAHDATIKGWARALSLRDKETEEHTCRVTGLALNLARMMNIPKKKLIHIQRGAILHDIGKLGIPDRILLKPDILTDDEWAIMRRHPLYALQILAPINYLKPALEIPYYHHEKWDGTGYPHGLKETQIPLAARIFAVADVYDALTSDRPYRVAWSHAAAKEYIRNNSGTHFDPDVVACFTRLMREKPSDALTPSIDCDW